MNQERLKLDRPCLENAEQIFLNNQFKKPDHNLDPPKWTKTELWGPRFCGRERICSGWGGENLPLV
jgi:hypothetical protein